MNSLALGIGIGSAFVLPGMFLVMKAVKNEMIARGSAAWPSVPGCITSSRLQKRVVKLGRSSYLARIEYEYTVDGTLYTGDRVSLEAEGSHSKRRELAIVERYPVGTQVEVFHDPQMPDDSVLDKRPPRKRYWASGIFCIIGGIAAALLTLI